MNEEEQERLLKEVKEKYPLGTKFKSAVSGIENISSGNYCIYDNFNEGVRDGNNFNAPWFYLDGKWAEIIELPKDYIVSLENLLLNLQIW